VRVANTAPWENTVRGALRAVNGATQTRVVSGAVIRRGKTHTALVVKVAGHPGRVYWAGRGPGRQRPFLGGLRPWSFGWHPYINSGGR
jgi:hypothetical protein